jgi:hypothetical protein
MHVQRQQKRSSGAAATAHMHLYTTTPLYTSHMMQVTGAVAGVCKGAGIRTLLAANAASDMTITHKPVLQLPLLPPAANVALPPTSSTLRLWAALRLILLVALRMASPWTEQQHTMSIATGKKAPRDLVVCQHSQ